MKVWKACFSGLVIVTTIGLFQQTSNTRAEVKKDFLQYQYENNDMAVTNNNPKIRVGTYNIAAGLHDHVQNTKKVAEAIKALDCDVIGLQEVDKGTKRNKGIDEPKIIEKVTGMHGYYHATVKLPGGTFGTAILSKYPFEKVRAVKLYQKNKDEEARQAIVAKIKIPSFNRPVYVINVHADWQYDGNTRGRQLDDLVNLVADGGDAKFKKDFPDILGAPVIVIGDFNDVSDSQAMHHLDGWFHELKESNFDYRSWPASNPMIAIDHIFSSSSNKWHIDKTYFPNKEEDRKNINWPTISDHLPLVEDLSLTEY